MFVQKRSFIANRSTEAVMKVVSVLPQLETPTTRKNKGFVHASEIIQAIHSSGISYSDTKNELQKRNRQHPYSADSWSRSLKRRNRRNQARGTRRLSVEKQKVIVAFWNSDEITRISSGKTTIIKNKSKNQQSVKVPTRYRLYSIGKTFSLFKAKYGHEYVSRSTFYAYKPKSVKKAKSKVDYCPICKLGERNELKLEQMSNNHEAIPQDLLDIQQEYRFHVNLYQKRTEEFKVALKSLSDNECLLVIDFKANISLGKGPVQDSTVFFSAPQRTVFGMIGFFRKNEQMYKIAFNYVSPILNHDSQMAIAMVKDVVQHSSFRRWFGVSHLAVWLDNAPSHFRTAEFLRGMRELEQMQISVSTNYFIEYHGRILLFNSIYQIRFI